MYRSNFLLIRKRKSEVIAVREDKKIRGEIFCQITMRDFISCAILQPETEVGCSRRSRESKIGQITTRNFCTHSIVENPMLCKEMTHKNVRTEGVFLWFTGWIKLTKVSPLENIYANGKIRYQFSKGTYTNNDESFISFQFN